jgi:DNA-binding CsgD family transcriptional regulator
VLQAYHLTDREAEVLQYLAAGLSIGSTARVLSITERTVKAHITSIYQKTGAENRVELLNLVGDTDP